MPQPLRLWPGVIAAVIVFLCWFIVPVLFPDIALGSMFTALGAAMAIVIWWLFFSRAPWGDRLGIVALAVVALIVTRLAVHPSIAGAMMGLMLAIYAIPVVAIVIAATAYLGRRLPVRARRTMMSAAVVLTCAAFLLLRTDGIIGFRSQLQWRWTPTAEERLLAQTAGEKDPMPAPAAPPAVVGPPSSTPAAPPVLSKPAAPSPVTSPASATLPSAPPAATPVEKPSEWSGFRGRERDGVTPNVRIATDWTASPPRELWRRPIGPGWSSFAVGGTIIYTQEQRGDDEIVSAYDLSTGAPVWRHRDAARFWESNAGPGPRGTPTVVNGRVYSLGATGIVNALDARTGAVLWSRNAAEDTGAPLPGWGFAGSPLVVRDLVIVATAGRLAAYELANGTPRWTAQTGGSGYSSPHLTTIDGVEQIVLLNTSGAASIAPADGAILWKHEWRSDGIVQPAILAEGDILIGSGSGGGEVGTRRLAVDHDADLPSTTGWRVTERWTSSGLKPYFNDFVVHKGHAYGVDGSILSCIDLGDGARKWKGGRYGQGQLMLLPEQDLLLVLSEEGEVALVSATPERFKEVSRFKAIEGKTWNHPVLIGDVLLVRNGEEMAAFRLTRQ